jgi:formate dehydrogenase alpha subunit
VAGLATVFGSGAMTNTIAEIEGADVIFVTGSNTTENHPVIGYLVRKAIRRGAKLIVADPRRIPLVDMAQVYLPLKPGTDVALFNALARVIINENLVNRDFISARTENFEALAAALDQYSPEQAAAITGVDAEDIVLAARLYGGAKNATILYTMGVTQHTSGTENVLALANLPLLTGNIGKPHTGMNPLRGQNNVQGACDMGALPSVFPGYQAVANEEILGKFSRAWGVPLSAQPGLTMTEMFQGMEKRKILALYVLGENPALTEPDANHAVENLEGLDFLVVQDIFLTETAQLADVVLPAASFAEKEGTFVNTERRVQRIRPAIKPRGESRPDWEILQDLAQRLGFSWDYETPAQIMEEIARLTPAYAGINYERLSQGGLHWPCPEVTHPGTPILHVGQFSRGLGKFSAVAYRPAAEEPSGDYPLILTTGRSLYHYHTAGMTGKSEGLVELHSEETLEINPVDAQMLSLVTGDRARVISRRGEVVSQVEVTDRVKEGVVFMTFHFPDTPCNVLTNQEFCPIAKTPELKVATVRVEKL